MFSTASKFPKFAFLALYTVNETGYLPGRNTQCVYGTEKAIAFLGSPFTQLPFDINIASVQRRYHWFRQLPNVSKFLFSALYAVHETVLFAGP